MKAPTLDEALRVFGVPAKAPVWEIVEKLELAGCIVGLVAGRIRVLYLPALMGEVEPLIAELKSRRSEWQRTCGCERDGTRRGACCHPVGREGGTPCRRH